MLQSRSTRRSLRLVRAGALAAALGPFAFAIPASGQGCPPHSPASPAPQALWGELRPTRILLDTTAWTGSQFPNLTYPITTSVDIENGWVFTSWYGGLMVYDGRGANASNPQRKLVVDGWSGAFPHWPRTGEFTQIVFSIDLPEGDDTIAAVGAINPMGVSIWSFPGEKTSFKALYQDSNKFIYQVHAAKIAGRDYAFAADFSGNAGVHIYDMTAARAFANPCVESQPNAPNCPGVYRGRMGAAEPAKYVSGVGVGGRYFVARSGGTSASTGVQIWEVTNPGNPSMIVESLRTGSIFVNGLAMWSQGGRQYLGVHIGQGGAGVGQIYDVTACLASGCTDLGNPIWQENLYGWPDSQQWRTVTFSRSGQTPTLHFGHSDACSSGESSSLQEEFLYDVSNPGSPVEITPNATIVDQGSDPNVPPVTVDYWSWYYNNTDRGLSWVATRSAKFNGAYLYRAATSLFDIHEWTGGGQNPPNSAFSWSPAQVYPGTLVDFSDASTGNPSSWSWLFEGGTPGTSNAQSPQDVTFSSVGPKSISLQAGNGAGLDSTPALQTLTVLDPAPQIGGLTGSPSSPFVCQPVTFTATGVTGQPTLTHTWRVKQGNNDPNGTVVAGPVVDNDGSVIWNIPPGQPPGPYSGELELSNGVGTAVRRAVVNVQSLPALPAGGAFAPTADPFTSGTVQFHVNAAGATEWSWDFGDGQGFQAFTTDPAAGPNPVRTYTTVGQKVVRVRVRNCTMAPGTFVLSGDLTINITQITPLEITEFRVGTETEFPCQLFCDFSPGQAIPFYAAVGGGPDEYIYDWNGDGFGGADDQSSATAVATHAYSCASPPVERDGGGDACL